MNTFIIEEESQFECEGVFHGEDTPPKRYNPILRRLNAGESDPNLQMHLILASHRHMPILQTFYEIEKKNLMVTCIGSERLECVNQETYDKLYTKGGFIKYQQQSRFRSVEVGISIGDDIEIFFKLIKLKQYVQEIDNTFFRYFHHLISPDWFANAVNSFHLSMLSEEQRKFRKRLVFKHNTKIIKSQHNFALSICFRKSSTLPGGIYKRIYLNYATEEIPRAHPDLDRRISESSDTDSDIDAESIESTDSGCIPSDISDNSDLEL